MRRLVLILLLASACYGDTFTSHLKPITDSTLDIGTGLLYWRFIYGDAFTDGTAYWQGNELYGFDEVDADSIVANVDLYGLAITGGDIIGTTITGDDITGIDILGTNITGTTVTGDTITDGTFVVSGGEISAGEIIATFGDIDVGGDSVTARHLYAWGGSSEMHTTDDPQLTLTHTAGVDYAEFYVDSHGVLTITPSSGETIIAGDVSADSAEFGSAADRTDFDTDGIMTLYGNARLTRHMAIGAGSWKIGAGAPTASFENHFPTLLFADGRDDAAHYGTWVPSRWDDTTDMTLYVHWKMDDDTKVGNVLWNLNYIGAKEGENPAGGGTLISQLSAGNHPQDEIIVTEFATKMLAANLERADDLGLKIWRNGDDGNDDLTENAELVAIHIHYTMNQFGEAFLGPVTDVLLLDDGASKLMLDDGASFLLLRL